MNSVVPISATTRSRWDSVIRHRLLSYRSRFLLLFIVSATFAAACSGDAEDAAMFNEEGEAMDEQEAVDARADAKAMVDSSDEASDFELTLFKNALHDAGEHLRLSELKGQPVVVNFWFPSCPPCRAEMPDFEKVFQNHRSDGVEFVGVQLLGLDSAQDGQDFIEEIGVSFAIGPDEDGSIVRAYEVIGFPSTFLIDRDLRIVRAWSGPLNEEKLEELLQEILP